MSLPKVDVFIPGGTEFRHLGESAHRWKDLRAVEGWYQLTLHSNGYWGSVLCIVVAESNDNWDMCNGFTKGETHVGEEFWYGLHVYPYNLKNYRTRDDQEKEFMGDSEKGTGIYHPDNQAAAAIAAELTLKEVSS